MKKRFFYLAVGLAAAVVVLVLIRLFPPERCRFWPPCVFRELTGLYCPACGNTRALSALVRGDVAGCFARNALLVPLLLCLLALAIRSRLARNPYFAWGIAITVIAFFILRNLPWHPFTLLAPH